MAEVTFPEAGTSTWHVHQGWFGPQDLGSIEVATGAAPAVTDSTDHDWPAVVRFGLPVLALVAVGVVAGDVIRGTTQGHRVTRVGVVAGCVGRPSWWRRS